MISEKSRKEKSIQIKKIFNSSIGKSNIVHEPTALQPDINDELIAREIYELITTLKVFILIINGNIIYFFSKKLIATLYGSLIRFYLLFLDKFTIIDVNRLK